MTETSQAPALTRTQSLVLGVMFLGLVLTGRLAAGALLAMLGPGWIGPRGSALVGQVFMFLVPALALLRLLPREPPAAPLVRPLAALLLLLAIPIGWIAAAAAQVATLGALERAAWSGLPSARERVMEMYGALLRFDGAANIAATILLVSVVGPILEEFAFRGVLQRLLERAAGPAVAIVGSALLFSALHFEPLGFAPRVLIGLGCGIAAHRFGSLLPAIAIHAGSNGLSLCLAFAVGAPTALGMNSPAPSQALPAVVLALAGSAAFLSLTRFAPVGRTRASDVVTGPA